MAGAGGPGNVLFVDFYGTGPGSRNLMGSAQPDPLEALASGGDKGGGVWLSIVDVASAATRSFSGGVNVLVGLEPHLDWIRKTAGLRDDEGELLGATVPNGACVLVGPCARVIGVVEDMRESLDAKPPMRYHLPLQQSNSPAKVAIMRAPSPSVGTLRAEMRAATPIGSMSLGLS